MSDTPPRTQLATEYVASPRLRDLLPDYQAYLIGEQRRPKGIDAYVRAARRFFTWLGEDATTADLTRRAVLRYKVQNGGGLAPSSMVKTLAALRDFAFWAASAEYDVIDPTVGIRRPRRRRPDPRPLHETEIADLLRAIAVPSGLTPHRHYDWVRNRLVIVTYLFTGARLTELSDLTWMSIRLDAGIIEIKNGKGGKDRVIPIHPALATELGAVPPDRARPHMAFYQNVDGSRASAKSLTHIFNRWLPERLRETLGEDTLHIHCHMLRSTFANQLVVNDVDLITVQELMGHANLDTLMHYVRSDVRRKRAGIEKLPDAGAGAAVVAMPALIVQPPPAPRPSTGVCRQCGNRFLFRRRAQRSSSVRSAAVCSIAARWRGPQQARELVSGREHAGTGPCGCDIINQA